MFIVFEGTDFAGKTTQINKLYDLLKKNDRKNIKTREPGGTPMAEEIRNILKSDNTLNVDTQFRLFQGARLDHIDKVIRPALKENKIVLCDRYVFSTYAYQNSALKDDYEWEKYFKEISNLGAWPDAAIFFETSYETFLKRSVNIKKDVLENASLVEFDKRHQHFEKAYYSPSFYVSNKALINTDDFTEDEVFTIVKHYIKKWYSLKLK